MAMQMIFCLETNKQAATDAVYISELLTYLYKRDNSLKISNIFMGTKSKYNSPKILREIQKKIKDYRHGETKVVYCVDTDNYESNYTHKQEYENVKKFCEEKGFDLVWFCHDVEEVFLGNEVPDSKKTETAGLYRRNNSIQKIKLDDLKRDQFKKSSSNILMILDKYLERINNQWSKYFG